MATDRVDEGVKVMKFEDLKLGGWYTYPSWGAPRRVRVLAMSDSGSSMPCARFDSGPGTPDYVTLYSNEQRLGALTEYDEYADAKALVELRVAAYAPDGHAMTWGEMITEDRKAYISLAAQLREQGWRGASK
jgi:hypothetical protein